MNDVVLGVRFTGDSKGLVSEVKLTRDALQSLNRDTEQGRAAATESRKVTEDYAQALKKMHDTLGTNTSEQKKFTDELKRGQDQTDKAKDSHESLSGAMFKGMGAVEIVRRAWEKSVEVLHEVVSATAAAQQSHARLEAVLRATGDSSGAAAARIDELVHSLEKTTQFDDTSLRDAATTIATFGRVSDDARERILRLSTDLAATGRGDLQTWVTALSKAGTEPALAIGVLERALGKLDPQLKIAIQNAANLGDKGKAQTLLFDEVARVVGGTATESYRGLTRQIEGTRKAYDDLLKVVGNEVFSAKSREAGMLETQLRSMADNFQTRMAIIKAAWNSLPAGLRALLGDAPTLTPQQQNASQLEHLQGVLAASRNAGQNTGRVEVQIALLEAAGRRMQPQSDPWNSEPGFAAPARRAPSGPMDMITDQDKLKLRAHELELEAAHQDALFRVRQEATQRSIALEAFRHEQGLVSEADYYGKKAALGEVAERDDVARIKRQIALEQGALKSDNAALAGAVARQSDTDIVAALTAIADRKAKINDLNVQLAGSEAKVGDARRKAAQELYAADAAAMDRQVSILRNRQDSERALARSTEEMRLQLQLLGKTDEQAAILSNRYKLDVQLADEQLKIRRQIADLQADKKTDHTTEIDDLTAQLSALPDAYKKNGDAQAAIIHNTFALREQLGVWTQISDIGSRFLADLVTNGRSAFRNLGNELKKFAADLIALIGKKWFLNLLAGVGAGGGAGGGLAAAAANAGANTASGAIANGITGAAGSYLASSGLWATGASNAVAIEGIGTVSATYTAGAATTATGIYEGITAVLADIPVYGWIALAVLALAAYFGGKGGGPKVGGSFMGSYTSAGDFAGSTAVPGTDNGRFFTPNQADTQTQAAVNSFAAGYFSQLAALGGHSPGASFGIGFDHDRNGTAQSRVSSSVLIGGREVYSNRDVSMDDKEVPAAIALEIKRGILAGLQASDIESGIVNILKTVVAKTATSEQIDTVLKLSTAYKNLGDTIHLLTADAVEQTRVALEKMNTNVANAQQGFALALQGNDPAAVLAAEQTLEQAVMNRYQSEIAMVMQLKQAIDDLKQSAYEFSISIAQKINAAGGSINIAGLASSRAGELRGSVGGDFDPAGQVRRVQQYVGAVDTWYQARRSAIERDAQAQAAAGQAAAEAQRAVYQARIAAVQTELQLTQQWVSVLDRASKMIDDMRLTGTNPLSAIGRLGLAKDDAATARDAFLKATGSAKVDAANKYLEALQRELGLLPEALQRPSPEYQAIYNDIIAQLSQVKGSAKTETERVRELQEQLVSLQSAANSISSVSAEALLSNNSQLQELNDQYIAQLTWAQGESTRLTDLQIQQHTEQLNLITGGQEIELFVARKNKEAVDLLQKIHDKIDAWATRVASGNPAGNGPPPPPPGGNGDGPIILDQPGAAAPKSVTVHIAVGAKVTREEVYDALRAYAPQLRRELLSS